MMNVVLFNLVVHIRVPLDESRCKMRCELCYVLPTCLIGDSVYRGGDDDIKVSFVSCSDNNIGITIDHMNSRI